jgi:putative endonuclease
VASWYEDRGFVVLARNWRTRTGEIDLVVRRDAVLAICEVKTRTSSRYGEPIEAVTPVKVRRLRKLAGAWLSDARDSGVLSGGSVDVRFDVASVTVTSDELAVEVFEGIC